MKKLSYFLMLIASFLILGIDVVSAKSVPGAISVDAGLNSGSLNYIKAVEFKMKRMSSGEYVYCLNRHKNIYAVENFFQTKKLDSGFKFLIENGFPNVSITGDSKVDYYITQMAIWLYQDMTSQYESYLDYKYNLGKELIVQNNNSESDPLRIIKHITILAEGAMNSRNEGVTSSCKSATLDFSSENYDFSLKNDYYVSKSILVKTTNSYKVSFVNNIEGAYITDVYGKKKETFLANEMFRVNVPKNTDAEKITVKVESTKMIQCANSGFAYEFRSKVSDHQNVMPAVIYDSEEMRVDAVGTIDFELNKNQLDDNDNNNNYNSNDNSGSNNDGSSSDNNNSTDNDVDNNNSNNSDNKNDGNSSDSNNKNENDNFSSIEDNCTGSSDSNCSNNNSSNENIFIPDTAFDSPITLGISGLLLTLFGLGFVYLNGKKKN